MVATKKRSAHGRRRPVHEWGSFLFEIKHVFSQYSFGVGSHLDRTAFSEHFHPQLEAKCVAPEKFAGRMTRFTIIGDRLVERDLWEQAATDQQPLGVGTLTFRGARSEYLGSIPFHALWDVMLTVAAGGFRFIYLHGAALKNGSARIKSISFYKEFDLNEV